MLFKQTNRHQKAAECFAVKTLTIFSSYSGSTSLSGLAAFGGSLSWKGGSFFWNTNFKRFVSMILYSLFFFLRKGINLNKPTHYKRSMLLFKNNYLKLTALINIISPKAEPDIHYKVKAEIWPNKTRVEDVSSSCLSLQIGSKLKALKESTERG